MMTNTQTSYGTIARALHWAVALLLITTFILGFVGGKIARTAETVELLKVLYSVHKTIGITVLGLAVFRVVWTLIQPKPAPLHPERRMETMVAEAVHWALYLALFIMPLSGWVVHASEVGFAPILWPFGQSLPFIPKSEAVAHVAGAVHWASSFVIFGAVGFHIVGALKHVFVDRDQTLARMTRGVSAGGGDHAKDDSAGKLFAPALAVSVWAIALSVGVVSSGVFTAQHLEQGGVQTQSSADAVQLSDAPQWIVETGVLTISVLQMGDQVEGQFENWSAQIGYDEDTGNGTVDVAIDTTSLTLGSVTEQALGPEFFNVENFASAAFAGDIVRQEDGAHIVEGAVTLLGKTASVDLPFALDITGDTAVVSGVAQLDRRDYDMGAGYEGEGTVGYIVEVNIELTAVRQN